MVDVCWVWRYSQVWGIIEVYVHKLICVCLIFNAFWDWSIWGIHQIACQGCQSGGEKVGSNQVLVWFISSYYINQSTLKVTGFWFYFKSLWKMKRKKNLLILLLLLLDRLQVRRDPHPMKMVDQRRENQRRKKTPKYPGETNEWFHILLTVWKRGLYIRLYDFFHNTPYVKYFLML